MPSFSRSQRSRSTAISASRPTKGVSRCCLTTISNRDRASIYSRTIIGQEVLVTPFTWRHHLLLPEEISFNHPCRSRTDDHHPWLGQILEPCCNRQGFSNRERIVPATTNLADDHWTSMNLKAHGETSLSRNYGPILERFDHTKPSTNAALDLVFVCLWVAKICHQSIAQIMRNIPLK